MLNFTRTQYTGNAICAYVRVNIHFNETKPRDGADDVGTVDRGR